MIYRPQDSTELSQIVTTSGDTVLLKTGQVYTAASVPDSLLAPANITLGSTGTGAKPVITGGVQRADWAFDAANNVYSRPAYAGNTLGNVTEDGVPMKFTTWGTNIATTAAQMATGASVPAWSGSMTYDPVNRIVYIRPSSGAAADHVYRVSEKRNGLYADATARSLRIADIEITQLSSLGILLYNKKDVQVQNVSIKVIGGCKESALYVGNGIQLSVGVNGAVVDGCELEDVFDSPVSSQLYEDVPAMIGSHRWANLRLKRYGLAGVEISTQRTSAQVISDIEVRDVASEDAGVNCWAGGRYPGTVVLNLTQGGTCGINRSFASRVTGKNQGRIYWGVRTGGICGIEDSTGTGSTISPPAGSTSGGLYGQTDLVKNITDNMGAPSGPTIVNTSALLGASFGPQWV